MGVGDYQESFDSSSGAGDGGGGGLGRMMSAADIDRKRRAIQGSAPAGQSFPQAEGTYPKDEHFFHANGNALIGAMRAGQVSPADGQNRMNALQNQLMQHRIKMGRQ
jgi:hypothetical protein